MDARRIKPLASKFAKQIRKKGIPLKHVILFVDGVFESCCRPFHPVEGYRFARQRAIYNGNHRAHGMMYQGLVGPDGILVGMWGPFQGRINDKNMFRQSRLFTRMRRNFGRRFCIFGDRGYMHGDPSLHVPFQGQAGRVEPGKSYNIACASCRIYAEWSFGKVKSLFAFVDFTKNQELYLQPIASYWFSATLLANCHSCLYGNETSQFFQVPE